MSSNRVPWRKSSYSAGHPSECIEVAGTDRRLQVIARDSKDPDGAIVAFSQGAWADLVHQIKSSARDLSC